MIAKNLAYWFSFSDSPTQMGESYSFHLPMETSTCLFSNFSPLLWWKALNYELLITSYLDLSYF